MEIRSAAAADLAAVKAITHETIKAVYPHYYPAGAVEFFLHHHRESSILEDLAAGRVFLCISAEQIAVGTVTIKENEICRLFVLPQFQGQGYGRALLTFAERKIAAQYPEIILDASLSAKSIYLKNGYRETAYHSIRTAHGDHLCYDVMKKTL